MSPASPIAPRLLRRFASECKASVAIPFAFAIVPIVGFVDLSVDYGRLLSAKSKLQTAVDNAALSLTTAALLGSTTVQADFQARLAGNFSRETPTGSLTVKTDKTGVCADASVTLNTGLTALLGVHAMTARAHACTKVKQETFEIALAIDNSGSMANKSSTAKTAITKMQAAMDAANALIDIINPTPANPRAAFSVVPFTTAVNVGVKYASAAFMDTTGGSSIHWKHFQRPSKAPWLPASKFDMFSAMTNATWGGCVEERPAPYTTTDTPASATIPDTLFVPFLYPDENDSNANALNDYLSDTPGNGVCNGANDVYATADNAYGRGDGQTKVCKYWRRTPATGQSGLTGFTLGPNLGCGSQAITTLTNDTAAAKSAIGGMIAKGDTNAASGIMWAWRTISPKGPFNTQPAAAIGPQNAKVYNYVSPQGAPNRKVIVLLSDGKNNWASASSDPNKGTYSAFGFYADNRLGAATTPTTASNARSQMDAATLSACANAKAAGVEIFTVGFTATDGIDDAGLTVLRSCATDASHSYVAADGAALMAAFRAIAASFMKLSLSR
jgi:Flp pilus assembly protein TadG